MILSNLLWNLSCGLFSQMGKMDMTAKRCPDELSLKLSGCVYKDASNVNQGWWSSIHRSNKIFHCFWYLEVLMRHKMMVDTNRSIRHSIFFTLKKGLCSSFICFKWWSFIFRNSCFQSCYLRKERIVIT